ncbi:lysine-specific demethylase 2A-like [Amphiura filiformis]|uniref:lysine-specific demethylase 2A-like n=1 Tax=Amphiura filiformis TaxID=82378 RepID=UPI003B22297E
MQSQLASIYECYICGSDDRSDPYNTLMECHQCNLVTHPECLRSEGYVGEGVIIDEMGNSWECPKCYAGESVEQVTEAYDPTPFVRRSRRLREKAQ